MQLFQNQNPNPNIIIMLSLKPKIQKQKVKNNPSTEAFFFMPISWISNSSSWVNILSILGIFQMSKYFQNLKIVF